jgi:hypothetical protein
MNLHRILFALAAVLMLGLSACATPATAEPVPTRTATPPDPAAVVQAFWDAMSAMEVDAAMALVAEDFKCRGSCYFSGKQPLQAYLQGYIDSGNVTTISNLLVEGDKVSYDWSITRNGVATSQGLGHESMLVQDGLIVFWENLRP